MSMFWDDAISMCDGASNSWSIFREVAINIWSIFWEAAINILSIFWDDAINMCYGGMVQLIAG